MAIPEFILRKMLVPGSYRYQHGQISFLIMNSYAPGTITSLRLIADNVEIPLDQVQIQMQGQSPTPASQISMRNPARMSTNIQISISGNISTPPTKLILYAETKEAGVIHFQVHDSSKPTRRGSRLLSLLRSPLQIGLKIGLRGSVPITLCGSGFSKDVISHHEIIMREIQKLHASIHTFIASGSSKKMLLGPYVVFRVDPFTPSGANENSNINAYLEFCRASCAPPILEVDANEVSALKLIEWMAQCHANLDRVGYWLIQGTAWQPWDLSQENAKIYAKKVKRFAQAIRLIHPDASIGMLCKYSLPGDGDNLIGQWNEAAFSEVGTSIDFVYWQVPVQEGVLRPTEYTDEESLNTALDYQEKLEKMIDRIRDQLSACIPNYAVLQAIDMTTPVRTDPKKIHNQIALSDSVFWEFLGLQSFMTLMAHRNAIAFAAIGVPNRLTDDSNFHFTSSEEKETSAYEIQYVPVSPAQTCTSDTKDASPDGSSKYVNAFAVYSPDNNRVYVTLANLHPDKRLRVTLSYPEVMPSKDLELTTLRSEALLTHGGSHTLTNSRKVTLRPHSVAHLSVRMKDN